VQAAGELLPALQSALDSGKVTVIDCPVDFAENLKLSEELNALAGAG
jgi:acetolactate synthase-1/2/3 large subunit